MSRIEQAVPYIKTKKTNYRFVVLALIFIVYAINYADRTNIGAVLPFIIDEFHINNFEAGAIASMFFLGYALSQIPAITGFRQRRKPRPPASTLLPPCLRRSSCRRWRCGLP